MFFGKSLLTENHNRSTSSICNGQIHPSRQLSLLHRNGVKEARVNQVKWRATSFTGALRRGARTALAATLLPS